MYPHRPLVSSSSIFSIFISLIAAPIASHGNSPSITFLTSQAFISAATHSHAASPHPTILPRPVALSHTSVAVVHIFHRTSFPFIYIIIIHVFLIYRCRLVFAAIRFYYFVISVLQCDRCPGVPIVFLSVVSFSFPLFSRVTHLFSPSVSPIPVDLFDPLCDAPRNSFTPSFLPDLPPTQYQVGKEKRRVSGHQWVGKEREDCETWHVNSLGFISASFAGGTDEGVLGGGVRL